MKKTALISYLLVIATAITSLSGIMLPAQAAETVEVIETDKLADHIVDCGTTLEQMQDVLPNKVSAKVKTQIAAQSQVLHTAGFNAGDWTLIDKNNVIRLDGSKISISGVSGTVKALSGGEYEDFVVEATLKGAEGQTNKNNFGLMLRATDVTDKGGDSYKGYYVGIGYDAGITALVAGYADGGWHSFARVPFGYEHGTEYKLKVMMYGENISVWLDGKHMLTKKSDLYDKGGVGIRTFGMLFDCSSLTVRTPTAGEIASVGADAYTTREVELGSWSCPEYDPATPGIYTFKTTVKGSDHPVECTVRSIAPLAPVSETLKALSYDNVNITDGFFRDYTKQMICVVIPAAIANVEKSTGGMPNIINAAKKNRGEDHGSFEGMFYVESDVHKVLEAMCYALSVDPMGDSAIVAAQNNIKAKLDEWIPYYIDAQEPSGYFNTYHTLNPSLIKYSDVGDHELYCMGHFMEAAIAHYNCTDGQDRRLLDAALKAADHLTQTFGLGAGQKNQIPGHQEIELALLKLAAKVLEIDPQDSAKATAYVELSAFLLGTRGNASVGSQYWQNHARVEEQTEAVGHAVRAGYMYTAMAELAAIDPEYLDKYNNALTSLWSDVTYTKQYVTGGVGSVASTESFGEPYHLLNGVAYCETCASIANMMWNRSMSELYSGSAFADVVENDLYNTVLGCVNFDGNRFYYDNSLATDEQRAEWFGTACCPPNLARTVLSVGGYIYNVGASSLYVNQYISNDADVTLSSKAVGVNMVSGMPKDGKVSITLSMADPAEFAIYLRMPSWSDKATVSINGVGVAVTPNADGYIVLSEDWADGDRIDVEFSMPVIFEESAEQVVTNRGYVAVRRGPLVYCAEQVDNTFDVSRAYIDTDVEAELIWTDSLDKKSDIYGVRDMYIIKLKGFIQGFTQDTPVTLTFVPFYARLNRDKGHMRVFVAKERIEDKPLESYALASASYTYWSDSAFSLKDGTDSKNFRWTSYYNNSHVVEDPWVQYDFNEPISVSGCRIYWYDDGGGVRLPDGFEIQYKNAYTEDFVPVMHEGEYACDNATGFSTYLFNDVVADSIRICMDNSTHAVGIVEWQLIEGNANAYDAIDDLWSRLDGMVAELDGKIAENATDIVEEVARLDSAIEVARKALEKADEEDRVELEAKIKGAESALNSAINGVAEELEATKKELEDKINDSNADIEELNRTAKKLSTDVSNAKALIDALGMKADVLDGKIDDLETSVKKLITDVANDLAASDAALKKSISENSDKIDEAFIKVQNDVNKMYALLSQKELDLSDKIAEVEQTTTAALATLKAAVEKVSTDLAASVEALNKAISEGDKANTDALAKAIEELNTAIQSAEKIAAASDESLKAGLGGQISAAQRAFNTSIGELKAALESARTDAQSADEALKAELERYVKKSLILPTVLGVVALATIAAASVAWAIVHKKKKS